MKYRRLMFQHKAPAGHRSRSTRLLLPHPSGFLLEIRSFFMCSQFSFIARHI